MFIHGAHAPNGPITQADIEAIKLGGFNGVKLLSYHHTQEDIRRLRAIGIRHFAIRCPDSIWPVLDEAGNETGRRYIPSALDYVARLEEQVLPLLELAPDADLILDNEPNVRGQWPGMWLEWAGRFAGSGDWRAFMSDVLTELLWKYPDLNWAYTPMAWTEPGAEEWMHPDLIARCRKITCHSYWQSLRIDPPGTPHPPGPSPMYYEQFGMNAKYIHDKFPDKPIIIGEYGNSICQKPEHERPTQLAIWDAMRRQYPLWLQWAASQNYISAAYLFIVGGSSDWFGFQPDPSVLNALPRLTIRPR